MFYATTVSSEDELRQIHELSRQNLKSSLTAEEKKEEGFVTWLYSYELLYQMHELAPSIIVKFEDAVIGYALVTLREASAFHNDLHIMMENLSSLHYKEKPLMSYSFYLMGQICIHKECRGKGVFEMLYHKHKEIYHKRYDMLVTEISTSNYRSLRAHQKIGFKTIHTYHDAMDEWEVVVWDWR